MQATQRRRRAVSDFPPVDGGVIHLLIRTIAQVADDEDGEVQPQNNRRRPAHTPEDENEDDDEVDADGDENMGEDRDESNDAQLIKKLVRYALACEASRTPIRRDGIKDKGIIPTTKSLGFHRQ
jgi:hypothetical protein